MANLDKRVADLEAKVTKAPLTPEQSAQLREQNYARLGMTREQIIAKFGSEANFAYYLMTTPSGETTPPPNDGLSAKDRYMRMLGK